MGIVLPSAQAIFEAVALLRKGELVAFPTETVYGLGADASNPEAVHKIFWAKGRPLEHPVIVHMASVDMLESWAKDIPSAAYELAEIFWPGPLTLILKRSGLVPDIVTGGQDTIGLRIPSHLVALQLLSAFGGGVAAPSANRFGHISPTTAQHVEAELGDKLRLILDGGDCQVGLESTIIDTTSACFRILRPGGVSRESISEVLGYIPEVVSKSSLRVSGSLESHYAPRTPTFLAVVDEVIAKYGVISLREKPQGFDGVWLQLPSSALAYGQRLYSALRELDEMKLEKIVIEPVPQTPQWLAVRDRLTRASLTVKNPME
jgi:L-threonylcarbamoyladenylate synthase